LFFDFLDCDVAAKMFFDAIFFELEFVFMFSFFLELSACLCECACIFAVSIEQFIELKGCFFEFLFFASEYFEFFFVLFFKFFDFADLLIDRLQLEFGFVFFSDELLLLFAQLLQFVLFLFCCLLVLFDGAIDILFLFELVFFSEGIDFSL